jgi:hypothetical protein
VIRLLGPWSKGSDFAGGRTELPEVDFQNKGVW